MSFRTSEFRLITTGLQYPEGPVYQKDGSVLVVEIQGKKLTRVLPDGTKETVANLGGGPNGAAIGPDGAVYVCNDGGLDFVPVGPVSVPTFQPADYVGGSIQRVVGSSYSALYNQCNGQNLRSPDDLVFDATGNFWFTDWGKTRPTDRDITGVYYAAADGTQNRIEVAWPARRPTALRFRPTTVASTLPRPTRAGYSTGNCRPPASSSPTPRRSTARIC